MRMLVAVVVTVQMVVVGGMCVIMLVGMDVVVGMGNTVMGVLVGMGMLMGVVVAATAAVVIVMMVVMHGVSPLHFSFII